MTIYAIFHKIDSHICIKNVLHTIFQVEITSYICYPVHFSYSGIQLNKFLYALFFSNAVLCTAC